MNKLAWSASLAIAVAIAAGDSACTITVNNGDDGGGGQGTSDSGGLDATAVDTGTQADAGTTGSQTDAATQADTSSTTDGGKCPRGIDTGIVACDQCIEAKCCQQWVTCSTPDDGGVDDAGASACVQLTQCVLDWVAADAGTLSSGEAVCGSAYSQSARDASHAFLTCKQACSMQCGG